MNTWTTKRIFPARLLVGAIILAACLGAGLLFRTAAQGASGSPTVPTGSAVTGTGALSGSAVAGTGTSGTAPPRNINDLLATRQVIRQATAKVAPTAIPHAPLLLPSSCPLTVPSASSISTPIRAAEGVKLVQHRSTATVVVGTDFYILDSGALLENPQQGVIVLVHPVDDACAHPGQQVEEKVYPTSGVHGAVTLTALQGPVVQFATADGTTGRFNVVTRQFS
ncbi:MAG: hypothetical protein ACR2M3_13175 [Thermomicrobiales bacterium]